MPVKRPEPPSGKTTQPAPVQTPGRKPWKKKTPVEVVLEQGEKLKQEIAEMEELLKRKREQLQKFEDVRKIFQS